MRFKTPSDSRTTTSDLVLPSETNHFNNIFGGELLSRIDRIACITANKHAKETTVTVSVNHVSFLSFVPLGSIVQLEAFVSRAFNTSMEVIIEARIVNLKNSNQKISDAIYTFVAIDKYGKTIAVPEITPETEIEKRHFEEALQRKELSLVLAKKLDPKKAKSLLSLFK